MTAIAALWWGLCLALLLGSAGLALLQPGLARRRARAPDREPVSMLIPVRGQAPGFSEASLSALRQDHAALEILFSAAGTDAAGAAAVRAVLAEAPPGKTLRFIRTAPAAGLNPKIGNLLEPYAAASHDVVVIKDATTLLAPGQVGAMLRSLTPGTGLVCAAPIARGPLGFTAHVEAALINTYGARLLLAASVIGVGVGIGAAMLLRRSDLDRAGGLAAVAPAVADDHAISKTLAGLGLRTVFTAETVDQGLGRRATASVWGRHLRWALCRRTTEPLAFWLEPMTGLAAACLAAWLAFASSALLAATLLAWVVVEIGLALAKGWPAGPLSLPAILLREALLPVLWLAALGTRTIAWGEQAVPVSSGRRP